MQKSNKNCGIQASSGSETEGVLHVGVNNPTIARQRPTIGRHGEEEHQQQSTQHAQELEATQPVVKLELTASRTGHAGDNPNTNSAAGQIYIGTESWLDRARAKAQAKVRERARA